MLVEQPEEFSELLCSLLKGWLPAGGRILESRFNVRRHVPAKRCTVDVDLLIERSGGGYAERRRCVAKLYRRHRGASVHDVLQNLRRQGFGGGPFLVPQPLAYDSARRLLILEWVEGEPLRSLLLAGRDAPIAMDQAASWLLRLHACSVSAARHYSLAHHLDTLARRGEELGAVCPEAGRLYISVLQNIEGLGRRTGPSIAAPTHRDFSPDNLIVDDERTTALDFDEFCQYDPLFDVAHFVAHLRFLGLISFGALHKFDTQAERFRACYETGARDYSVVRYRLYLAIAFLKLAYIAAVVRRPPDREALACALLQEARQIALGGSS